MPCLFLVFVVPSCMCNMLNILLCCLLPHFCHTYVPTTDLRPVCVHVWLHVPGFHNEGEGRVKHGDGKLKCLLDSSQSLSVRRLHVCAQRALILSTCSNIGSKEFAGSAL